MLAVDRAASHNLAIGLNGQAADRLHGGSAGQIRRDQTVAIKSGVEAAARVVAGQGKHASGSPPRDDLAVRLHRDGERGVGFDRAEVGRDFAVATETGIQRPIRAAAGGNRVVHRDRHRCCAARLGVDRTICCKRNAVVGQQAEGTAAGQNIRIHLDQIGGHR